MPEYLYEDPDTGKVISVIQGVHDEHIFEIEGKNKLFGDIDISGAKNAVLPLMAAAILNDRALTITNVPKLSDSITMGNLIKGMGGEVNFDHSSIIIDLCIYLF